MCCDGAPVALHDALDLLVQKMIAADQDGGEVEATFAPAEGKPGLIATLRLDLRESE